jgi:hypothetical protein
MATLGRDYSGLTEWDIKEMLKQAAIDTAFELRVQQQKIAVLEGRLMSLEIEKENNEKIKKKLDNRKRKIQVD